MTRNALFISYLVWAAALAARAEETPTPVTIRVVDEDSGKPLTQFKYDYDIASPDRHKFPSHKENMEAKTKDGVIRIPAPRRCRLEVMVTAPDHLLGGGTYPVLPDDQKRTITVELSRGGTVRGVVVDAQSGKPMSGARVSPVFPSIPGGSSVDRDQAVKTGADGSFTLRGLNDWYLGVCVEHNGYRTFEDSEPFLRKALPSDFKKDLGTIRLEPLPPGTPEEADPGPEQREGKLRLFGRVTDFQGKPVGPYRIVAAELSFPDTPLGYANEAKNVPAGNPWELTLVFNMDMTDADWVWVMAEAPGFAPSVQLVRRESTAKPVDFQLQRGYSLSGKIEGPAVSAGKAVVMVQPMYLFAHNPPEGRDGPLCGIQMSRASVKSVGAFQFANLAPERYILQVLAPGATPLQRLVTIRGKDVHLASPLKLRAAGRIEGIAFDDDGEPLVLESGDWSSPVALDPKIGETLWVQRRPDIISPLMNFTTDENGRFIVENVPVGRNSLGFVSRRAHPMDVAPGQDSYFVQVLPNRTTQVRINVPESSDLCWKTPVEVTVGNGSPEHLMTGGCVANPDFFKPRDWNDPFGSGIALAFEPLGDQAVSSPDFWEATSVVIPPTGGAARRVLTGIQPGRYRVSFRTSEYYWRDDAVIRPPLSKTAEVQRSMKEPLRFRLPAASVEVDFEHPKEDAKRWGHTFLAAVVDRGNVVRQQYAGYRDNLSADSRNPRPHLDFLPPGRYTLVAWERDSGWARSGPIEVEEGKIANGGVLKFQRGGTLQGRIALPDICAVPDRVVAVDSGGLGIPVDTKWTREGYTFAVHNLWPGKWTLRALDDAQNVIVEKKVELKATETVDLE